MTGLEPVLAAVLIGGLVWIAAGRDGLSAPVRGGLSGTARAVAHEGRQAAGRQRAASAPGRARRAAVRRKRLGRTRTGRAVLAGQRATLAAGRAARATAPVVIAAGRAAPAGWREGWTGGRQRATDRREDRAARVASGEVVRWRDRLIADARRCTWESGYYSPKRLVCGRPVEPGLLVCSKHAHRLRDSGVDPAASQTSPASGGGGTSEEVTGMPGRSTLELADVDQLAAALTEIRDAALSVMEHAQRAAEMSRALPDAMTGAPWSPGARVEQAIGALAEHAPPVAAFEAWFEAAMAASLALKQTLDPVRESVSQVKGVEGDVRAFAHT